MGFLLRLSAYKLHWKADFLISILFFSFGFLSLTDINRTLGFGGFYILVRKMVLAAK